MRLPWVEPEYGTDAPRRRSTLDRRSDGQRWFRTAYFVKGFGCWPWRRSGQGAGPASESLQGRNPRGGVLWRGAGPASESLQGRNPRGGVLWRGALWRFRHRGRECRAAARGSRARIDSAGERKGSAVVSTSRVGEWRSGLGRSVRRQV